MSAIVFNYGKGDSTSFGSRAAMRIFVIKLITFVGGTFAKSVSYMKRLKSFTILRIKMNNFYHRQTTRTKRMSLLMYTVLSCACRVIFV